MTEESWGSDFDRPAEKKSVLPILGWIFGAGCLLFVIVLIVGGIWFARFYGKATDPEIQWAAVAEVLPIDERPDGVTIFGVNRTENRIWVMQLGDGEHQAHLHFMSGAGIEHRRSAFFGDAAPFTIDVQGRALKAVRVDSEASESGEPSFADLISSFVPGESMRVELSPPESETLLLLQFTALESTEPVDEQRVVDFLDHFDLTSVR